MSENSTLTAALIAAGIVLVLAPTLVPIPTVLVHDTGGSSHMGPDQLRERGYTIVAYENLSERGQELYVQTLKHGGRYTVSEGEGAPEFNYSSTSPVAGFGGARPGAIVIERPPDGDLPPSDERLDEARFIIEHRQERANETGEPVPSEEEIRRQIARYDAISVRTDKPPIGDPASLARLLSAAAGVVLIGVGGYRRSQPN